MVSIFFTPHTDVPDDSALRLRSFSRQSSSFLGKSPRLASDAVLEYIRSNGPKPDTELIGSHLYLLPTTDR